MTRSRKSQKTKQGSHSGKKNLQQDSLENKENIDNVNIPKEDFVHSTSKKPKKTPKQSSELSTEAGAADSPPPVDQEPQQQQWEARAVAYFNEVDEFNLFSPTIARRLAAAESRAIPVSVTPDDTLEQLEIEFQKRSSELLEEEENLKACFEELEDDDDEEELNLEMRKLTIGKTK